MKKSSLLVVVIMLFGFATSLLAQDFEGRVCQSSFSGDGWYGCPVMLYAGDVIDIHCEGCVSGNALFGDGWELMDISESEDGQKVFGSQDGSRYTVQKTGRYSVDVYYSFIDYQPGERECEEIIGKDFVTGAAISYVSCSDGQGIYENGQGTVTIVIEIIQPSPQRPVPTGNTTTAIPATSVAVVSSPSSQATATPTNEVIIVDYGEEPPRNVFAMVDTNAMTAAPKIYITATPAPAGSITSKGILDSDSPFADFMAQPIIPYALIAIGSFIVGVIGMRFKPLRIFVILAVLLYIGAILDGSGILYNFPLGGLLNSIYRLVFLGVNAHTTMGVIGLAALFIGGLLGRRKPAPHYISPTS